MDFSYTPQEQRFREEVRSWLAQHKPREARPTDGVPMREFDLAWQARKFQGGWGGIAWPTEYGGRGLSLVEQLIWHEECARADAPTLGCLTITLNHAGPTLMAYGNDSQKAFHLPRILRGESLWCQGFSEPGAGSDLAALRLQAVVDGEHLVLHGQKIWTSHGHLADFQETLVRTDASGARHKGITWVIVDMKTPGIAIRPIETMVPGNRHFCEVFYDAVRVPLGNVVGPLNEGWRVAMSTLAFERGGAVFALALELSRNVEDLVALARRTPRPGGRGAWIEDDAMGTRLAALRAESAALRSCIYVTAARDREQALPGPESAMAYLFFAELAQRVNEAAMELLGPNGLELGETGDDWPHRFLAERMYVIAGGSAEVRRNIIAERMLRLPRSY